MSFLLLISCMSSTDEGTVGADPSAPHVETLDCGKGVLALNSWENKAAQPDLSWPGGILPVVELCKLTPLPNCRVQATVYTPSKAELGFASRIQDYEEHPVWLELGEGQCALPIAGSHRAQVAPCPGDGKPPSHLAALQVQCSDGEIAWVTLEDFLAGGGVQL